MRSFRRHGKDKKGAPTGKGETVSLNDQSEYFGETVATQLEMKRNYARTKRRITYDCFNAVVIDGRVSCTRGHFTHSIPLLTVLRGGSTAVCVKCADYDDGEKPCG